VLDAEGNRVGPGFIDLQINGGFGIDLQSDPAAVWQLGERLPSIGVTAFLPTLTTNGHAHVAEALAALERRPVDYVGAEPLGWHLEGPWLSEAKRGAHARSKLEPIPDELPDWYAPEHGVALVTLDPELPGAERAVATLVDRGVVVSFGHTAAAQPFADLAYGWGATMGTHLFNAMVGLHHRDPGLAATLLSERCSAFFGLIVDGEHVAPPLVDIAWRLAPDRLVLVSDAVAPLGMTEQRVHRLDDGTLAGAVAGLDAGVRNLAAFTGCSTGAAHRAASARPADVLVDQTRGELWPGAPMPWCSTTMAAGGNDHRRRAGVSSRRLSRPPSSAPVPRRWSCARTRAVVMRPYPGGGHAPVPGRRGRVAACPASSSVTSAHATVCSPRNPSRSSVESSWSTP
ncbi:MAG: hypothetical protein R2710_11605, partial [Acidimicrobiales bacterium]